MNIYFAFYLDPLGLSRLEYLIKKKNTLNGYFSF